MTPVQEANSDNLGNLFDFLHGDCILSVAILMSTHNIHFHDKIRKKILNICFLELLEGFCRD